ncbi:MAG: glycosidase [Deltaproteobacteria bacterium]|nr:glycosidase [Deltaproteobacteria bacterium]
MGVRLRFFGVARALAFSLSTCGTAPATQGPSGDGGAPHGPLIDPRLIAPDAGERPATTDAGEPTRDPVNGLRIYQIMVEAFQDGDPARGFGTGYGSSVHLGDLKGVTRALPYIASLGVNAIWLTPIFDSEGSSALDATGYFARNYFAIDPHFGTFDDARELVDAAHALGLYVFFDGVFGHHKSGVRAAPSGALPLGRDNPVSYPGSLPFYKEVATYWIDALEIDGWRLDQAYQVPPEAWREIRTAVEAKCAERRAAAKRWGTLGYMVAEVWKGAREIARAAYGTRDAPALLSAFDFPLRDALVEVLATLEDGTRGKPASALNAALAEAAATYPAHARPNLMLTNHDTVRFGDLIQRAGFGGKETSDYWKRHKAAFSFLAAHTGPITIYYGDEIGDEVPDFAAQVSGNCVRRGLCDDHVSRTSGQVSGFDARQTDLKDALSALLRLRDAHPALAHGARTNLVATDTVFADLKSFAGERIVYALNVATAPTSIQFSRAPGSRARLRDLIDGTVFIGADNRITVSLDALGFRLLRVE